MSDDQSYHAGYDDFLDAVENGQPYYLAGSDGKGWLPPRVVDPETGDPELERQPLPDTGEVDAVTVTHVPIPDFGDDVPYVVAIASFGPVRLTGQLREVELAEATAGIEVTVDVDTTETTGDRILVFRPV